MGRFRTIKKQLWDLGVKAFNDELPTQAAALAFYSALSFAPLVLLTLAALSTMGLNLQGQFLTEVEKLMGGGAAGTFREVIRYADEHPEFVRSANIFGILALLLSASGIFAQLRTSLNKIFGCPVNEQRSDLTNYLLHRLVSVFVVVAFIVVSIASLVASAFLNLLINPQMALVGQVVHTAATFTIFTLIFTALFHWMPDIKMSGRSSWLGGVSTAGLFLAGKFLISFYLERGAYDLAYGAAGSIVVLLLWVYYSSFTIFVGAEIASLRAQAQTLDSRSIPYEKPSALSHSDTDTWIRPRPTGNARASGPRRHEGFAQR